MSDKVTLSAKSRTTDFGSAGSRRLIRAGYIPAVIYGKQAPVHCAVNAKEFGMKMHTFTGSTLVTLSVDGTDHTVFVKNYQENLLKGIIQHIDFYEVTAGSKVRAHVVIELVGTPAGVRNGGVLDQVLHEVDIECLPKDLPSEIKVDVSALEINESIRVGQLAGSTHLKTRQLQQSRQSRLRKQLLQRMQPQLRVQIQQPPQQHQRQNNACYLWLRESRAEVRRHTA